MKLSPQTNWENNAIQFPRLIAEAEAAGAFTGPVVQAMAFSMDLYYGDVLQIIDRAQKEWDEIKERT